MATQFNTANVRLWNLPEGEVAKVTATGMTNPDYTRLEYIQNDINYTSTIDLGIKCNTQYTYLVTLMPTAKTATEVNIFGSNAGNAGLRMYIKNSGSTPFYYLEANSPQWSYNRLNSFALNQKLQIRVTPSTTYFYNIQQGMTTSWGVPLANYTTGSTFKIYFASGLAINLYSVEILDQNGQRLFYGTPSKRNADNIYGLYDTVSGNFFTSTSNQQYITGGNPYASNVLWSRVPQDQFVQYTYLDSNGNPYCQVSDINITSTTALEIKGQWYANTLGGWRKMFGNTSLFMYGKTVTQTLCWSFNGNTYETPSTALSATETFTTKFVPNEGIYWNGTQIANLTNVTFDPTVQTPFYIFDYDPTTSGSQSRASFRVYYIKMWDTANSNVLTHYLIPVQWRSNQQTGLYDLFGGGFYDNVNSSVTTAFTTGQEL
jgi:hypothetical protein